MAMEIWYHLPGGLTDPSTLLSDLIDEDEEGLREDEEASEDIEEENA